MQEDFLKLRNIRQHKGFSIKDVSAVLNIRSSYLIDIEEENFDDLPEDVYAIGFIRNYAKFLNTDSDELVRRFKESRHIEEIPAQNDIDITILNKLNKNFNELSKQMTSSYKTKVVFSIVLTTVLLYVIYLIE